MHARTSSCARTRYGADLATPQGAPRRSSMHVVRWTLHTARAARLGAAHNLPIGRQRFAAGCQVHRLASRWDVSASQSLASCETLDLLGAQVGRLCATGAFLLRCLRPILGHRPATPTLCAILKCSSADSSFCCTGHSVARPSEVEGSSIDDDSESVCVGIRYARGALGCHCLGHSRDVQCCDRQVSGLAPGQLTG